MEKRREARHRSENMIDLQLDLPLGAKIPVPSHSNIIFTRGKLGEKLHQPSGYFNLGDPYCRQLSTEYNCLHDPHLKYYFNRKDNFKRLKREGFITRDSRVVCSLKDCNEFNNYLTKLRLDKEAVARQEKEMLQTHLAKFKDASNLNDTKQRTSSFKSKGCRRGKGACDEDHTKSQPEMGQEGAKLPGSVRKYSRSGPVLLPQLSCEKPGGKPPAQKETRDSYLAEDGHPSMGPDVCRQPVPPAHPKPSAHTGAGRRGTHFKPASQARLLPRRFVDTLLGSCMPRDA